MNKAYSLKKKKGEKKSQQLGKILHLLYFCIPKKKYKQDSQFRLVLSSSFQIRLGNSLYWTLFTQQYYYINILR